MGYKLQLPIGTTQSWQITLLDQQGNPVTAYTSADTLTCQVWVGADQPVLFQPTVAWISAPAGTITLTIAANQTTSLEAGEYTIRMTVDNVALPDSYLILTASPGSATAYTSYSKYRDLLDYLPSLEQLQDSKDTEGFARQRQKARQWVERTIQRNRVNASGYSSLGPAGPTTYGWWSGWWMLGQDDPVLQGYLDANLLMLKPIVIEMVSKKAIGYVCKAQIGPDDKQTNWQSMGAQFDWEAESLMCKYTAEIDLNGDAYSDITIPCGKASYR